MTSQARLYIANRVNIKWDLYFPIRTIRAGEDNLDCITALACQVTPLSDMWRGFGASPTLATPSSAKKQKQQN